MKEDLTRIPIPPLSETKAPIILAFSIIRFDCYNIKIAPSIAVVLFIVKFKLLISS